jgi:CubicO group peptidase (beta-lactamase class C family)
MTLLFPRRRLLSTALVFVLATARPAPLVADEFRAARGLISSAIAEGKTPSVALAVSKGGRILYADGFGWSDREAQVKATADTVYGLGSVSKPIIATAIMILNAEHRLRIDHPVNEYLGAARLSTRLSIVQAPTVRHLLQHTSGLGPYYQTYFADEPEVPPEMDVVIRRYGQIFWRPGEGFQ